MSEQSVDSGENKPNTSKKKPSSEKAETIDKLEKKSKSNNPSEQRPKILAIVLIKQMTELEKLKDGRRIYNNRTIYTGFDNNHIKHFLEFKQLMYENLLLNDDLSSNKDEKLTVQSAIFSTFCFDPEFIIPFVDKHKIKVFP